MSPTSSKDLYKVPIPSRPSVWSNPAQLILGLIWANLFTFGCVMVNGAQLVMLVPLRAVIIVLPLPILKRVHEAGIRWTKGAFGRLCVFICEWFAPTTMLITLEGDNLKAEDVFVLDKDGKIVALNLPQKLVLMANHQIYADWLYLWCLTYYAGLEKDVLILLKKSLKWVPIVGWGMQCFHFIFLARHWASDKLQLSDQLSRLAARAQVLSTPLALMIFPEGTLVSNDTRPVSKKFSEKIAVADMQQMLLPRSTGLFYCLRSLSPQTPGLKLLDATIAYAGIPSQGYGQTYYTLRSIYFAGIPPPQIHVHLRLFDVHKDLPIGELSKTADAKRQLSRTQREKDMDASAEEAAVFDEWVRSRWREKDVLMERYHTTGTFETHTRKDIRETETATGKEKIFLSGTTSRTYELPIVLHSKWDILDAFSCLAAIIIPMSVWYLWKHLV